MQLSTAFEPIEVGDDKFRLSIEYNDEITLNDNSLSEDLENLSEVSCNCEDRFEAFEDLEQEKYFDEPEAREYNRDLELTLQNSTSLEKATAEPSLFAFKGGFTKAKEIYSEGFENIIQSIERLEEETEAFESFNEFKQRNGTTTGIRNFENFEEDEASAITDTPVNQIVDKPTTDDEDLKDYEISFSDNEKEALHEEEAKLDNEVIETETIKEKVEPLEKSYKCNWKRFFLILTFILLTFGVTAAAVDVSMKLKAGTANGSASTFKEKLLSLRNGNDAEQVMENVTNDAVKAANEGKNTAEKAEKEGKVAAKAAKKGKK